MVEEHKSKKENTKQEKKETPIPPSSNSNTVTMSVDGRTITAKKGSNLLEVLNMNGYHIPHLCYHPRLKPEGRCRMCVVEIEGARTLVASCTATAQEGLKVRTNTHRVISSRKTTMELILTNHNLRCMVCPSNLNCKLQQYAEQLSLKELPFDPVERKDAIDASNPSVIRDNSKCILCGRCVQVCNDVQTINAIGFQNRGQQTRIQSPFNQDFNASNCVNCGQCVILCPTGALFEQDHITDVTKAIDEKEKSGKLIVVQTAPSVRFALGECFGEKPGGITTGKMVSALRLLGFDKVFDTDLAADLTITEEATEFVERFKENKSLPMITSCCPAWVKFAEEFFPDQLNHLSTCRSPQAMMSSVIKKLYAKKLDKNPEDIIVVDIMPCTAKKFEAARPEFAGETDYVLTTVELAKMLKAKNIDYLKLDDQEFDNPLGESTGAGLIFGRSGGVMEAALRTAADVLTGEDLEKVDYEAVRGMLTLKEASLHVANKEIKVCVVHTLKEARKVMEQIRAGTSPYHFIEVMACYGGCIGGGGQPRYERVETVEARMKAVKSGDENKPLRKSHKNPSVLKIYEEHLDHFGSEKAHKYLHTHFTKRDVV